MTYLLKQPLYIEYIVTETLNASFLTHTTRLPKTINKPNSNLLHHSILFLYIYQVIQYMNKIIKNRHTHLLSFSNKTALVFSEVLGGPLLGLLLVALVLEDLDLVLLALDVLARPGAHRRHRGAPQGLF